VSSRRFRYWIALVVGDFLFVEREDSTPTVEWHGQGRPILMHEHNDEGLRKAFYTALTEIPWLAPKVRYAVMTELSRSQREQNIKTEKARTLTLRAMIDERYAQMKQSGQRRPRGGWRVRAIEEIAAKTGMKVETMLRRFYPRLKRPRK
jgi:hypothetical protein